MKTILVVIAAITLVIGPCYGQGGGGKRGAPARREDPEKQRIEEAKRKAADEAYKTGLRQIPDAKQKSDPWKNAR